MKRLVNPTLALFVLTVMGFCFFSGCRNKDGNNNPYQTNIFPAVKVPVTLSSNKKLSQEFVARHFWDEFLKEDRLLRLSPDTSTVLGIKPKVFEETFDNYIVSLSRVDDTIAQSSMEKLVDRAVKMADDGYPYFFSKIMQVSEKVLFDAHSPMINEELYMPVLDGIGRCTAIPDNVKDSFRWQMAICNKNRVGSIAADFRYANSYGRQSAMHLISSDYLLVFFNDPDCPNCRDALEKMKKSGVIRDLIGMGVLKVLAVSPGGKTNLWDERREDFPKEWIYAYSPDGELNQGTIYSLRTSPSIYLLDEEKRVVLKDASLQRALRTLRAISDHYVDIQ